MARFWTGQTSFASGEVSPLLAARTDLTAYNTGGREVTNMLPTAQGALINRPGTRRLTSTYSAGSRLIPFTFNSTQAFVLRYRTNGVVDVYDSSNSIGTILTSFNSYAYTAAQLASLRYLQSGDILYLFHQDVPVQKISRYSNTSWSCTQVAFQNGPYADWNFDPYDAASSYRRFRLVSGWNTLRLQSDVQISASAGNHLGQKIKLEVTIKGGGDSLQMQIPGGNSGTVSSPTYTPYGAFTIESSGKWTGEWVLYALYPDSEDGTWGEVKRYSAANDDKNFAYQTDVEEYGTQYYITWGHIDADDVGNTRDLNLVLSWGGGLAIRQVQVTSVYSNMAYNATVADGLSGDTPYTGRWAWEAFSPSYGYPAMGIFYQERLVLARTALLRQTIWMSKSASWEDFIVHEPLEDTDAIMVTLAAKKIDNIQGLASRDDLVVLTAGGEWALRAGAKTDVLTPSSLNLNPVSFIGSANLDPLDVGPMTLYVQRANRVVRGIGYGEGAYDIKELSVLSQHLPGDDPIISWDFQQSPWSVVWMVCASGKVLSLTIQQEHQVLGWAKHYFPWKITDVCCLPGPDQDEVYFLDSSGYMYLLYHRYDTGNITEYWTDNGYGYTSVFEGMELEQNMGGPLQGRHKNIVGAMFRVKGAMGFHAGVVNENNGGLDQVQWQDQTNPAYRSAPATGDIIVRLPGGFGRHGRVRVENRGPYPLSLLGIFSEVEVNDG